MPSPSHIDKSTPSDGRDLLRALRMPFQLQSLVFVALTSVLLGLFIGGGLIRLLLSLAAIWLILVWLTQYALALIDDAANGVRESRTASAEMATAFLDARAWIHPALAVAIGVMLYLNPALPRWPVLLLAALLFPASLGVCAMSGHALRGLHPGELARVMRGFGVWYPALVVFVLACAGLGMLVARSSTSMMLSVASIEMLLLLAYACIGGAMYIRRHELDFHPRNSPERLAQRREEERRAQRQQILDGLYKDLRVRESARAMAEAARWLRASAPEHLKGDVHALLQAGVHWNEPREYPRLLRGLLPAMLELKQPALALSLADAGIAATPEFAPATDADTIALASYARQTGRKRLAQTLLENYLRATPQAGAEVRAMLPGTP